MRDKYELPTYEMELPLGFNLNDFRERSERGIGKLWLLCLDRESGVWRFKGILIKENVRVFIDIFSPHQKSCKQKDTLFVTTPWYQNLTALQVARIVQEEVGAEKIYHEGMQVFE